MRAVPCLSGNRNGLDSLNAYPPLSAASPLPVVPPRRSFARAASTCNYNGPFGDFFDQPKVADAVWDLFRDVLGTEKMAVRLVIGVASLPLGMPIELDYMRAFVIDDE